MVAGRWEREMKLVVLGASGGCGREVVQQAQAAGYRVVVVGRESSDLPTGDGLEEYRGNLTDEEFLSRAVEGADVIVLAVGFRLGGLGFWNRPKDPEFLEGCARATVAAARAQGVGRIMAISAGGVSDSYEAMPWIFRVFIRSTSLRHVYPELAKMERVLLDSGLDVCIPRPSGLTDEPGGGEVVMPTTYRGQATISRADVAAWMLEQLPAQPFPYKTPLITVTGG